MVEAVNYIMYTRGSASDFDDWKTEGWKFSDVLPYFKKVIVLQWLCLNHQTETFEAPDVNESVHGRGGSIKVSMKHSEAAQQFMSIINTEFGVDICDDLQDFKTVNKVDFWPKFIDPRSGIRSDATHAYVHPIRNSHTNLAVLLTSKVSKVLFQGTVAIGIEYLSK